MSKQPNYVFDDELYHWGIPGMRWGERRFQNEDGSLTPEGRERYGVDNEREKAKAMYKTEKYKAKLESKARKEALARAAKEEKYAIKKQAKNNRLAQREQSKSDKISRIDKSKIDREQSKLDRKLAKVKMKEKDVDGMKNVLNRTKKYTMSNEELSRAIDRLKLEAEYNKQYLLATKPSSALTKADRFFDSSTGKAVLELSKAVLPTIATQVSGKIADKLLSDKKPSEMDQLDIEKKKADIQQTLANARNTNSIADERDRKAKNPDYQQEHEKEVKDRAKRMFGDKNNSEIKENTKTKQSNNIKIKSSDDQNKAFYDRIEKKVAGVANKAANSLASTASAEINKHAQTFANEAKKGVQEGVNEALKDLLGNSGSSQPTKSLPVYSQEEMFRILNAMGRLR